MEERFHLEGLPERSLTVWLFKDVANCREIQEQILAGAAETEFALINAALVPDLVILRSAAHKAATAAQRNRLRTRSLHSECIVNISGSKHIRESLTRFGVSPECKHLLIARFDSTPSDLEAAQSLVQGTQTALADLPALTDGPLITKLYKLAPPELNVGSVVDAILCRIAARDC